MMRRKEKKKNSTAVDGGGDVRRHSEWEVRPGGMLVQRRTAGDESIIPTIRVRVKYQTMNHEISISSQATFGELKKLLSGPTGLNHHDQKLFFKDKERNSSAFLDLCGVKDRSKIVAMEDPLSQEKRFLEMRRSVKVERASRSISEVSLEVDKLGAQVASMDSIISKGGRVAERDLVRLIESLMNQLLRLDSITADGDAKLHRKIQVTRIQRYVETVDLLKVKNCGRSDSRKPSSSAKKASARPQNLPLPPLEEEEEVETARSSGSTVVTTKWETFDSTPLRHPSSSGPTATKLNWEFFD